MEAIRNTNTRNTRTDTTALVYVVNTLKDVLEADYEAMGQILPPPCSTPDEEGEASPLLQLILQQKLDVFVDEQARSQRMTEIG